MPVEFWSTPAGIAERVDMLAEALTWQTVNNAMQFYGSEAGAKETEWISALLPTTCPTCRNRDGKRYKLGQFVPKMPVHINCYCHWGIIF